MKKLFLLIVYCMVIITSCKRTTTPYDIYPISSLANTDSGPFSKVVFSGTGNLMLYYGAKHEVEVIGLGDKNVNGNVLTITGTGNFMVTSPDFSELEIKGGVGNILSQNQLQSKNLTILSSASGNIILDVNVQQALLVSMLSGNVSLKGKTDKILVNHTIGNYTGCELVSRVASVTVGVGNVSVYANDSLTVLAGTGNVTYGGNPIVIKSSSFTGVVTKDTGCR